MTSGINSVTSDCRKEASICGVGTRPASRFDLTNACLEARRRSRAVGAVGGCGGAAAVAIISGGGGEHTTPRAKRRQDGAWVAQQDTNPSS